MRIIHLVGEGLEVRVTQELKHLGYKPLVNNNLPLEIREIVYEGRTDSIIGQFWPKLNKTEIDYGFGKEEVYVNGQLFLLNRTVESEKKIDEALKDVYVGPRMTVGEASES